MTTTSATAVPAAVTTPAADAPSLADLVAALLEQPDAVPGSTPALVPADVPAPAGFCLFCLQIPVLRG